jgi:putative transposase
MGAVEGLSPGVGVSVACRALGVARATLYRHRRRRERGYRCQPQRPTPARALSGKERDKVLEVLHTPRFVDRSPAQVYATLLDKNTYLCSVRTMYRILDGAGEARERRRQLTHPRYVKPQLLATHPNEVWSWDITKLLGPRKWVYFYLYVILDIFSRYVVGWMVAERESATLAKKLIASSCRNHAIEGGQLTVHADRGSSMRSKCVAHLLADLGVTKTHTRPYTSTDNPYSESHFKTLKYCPEFPGRFGSPQDARAFCRMFFPWYNREHRHSGIAYLTPEAVHYGDAARLLENRRVVLGQAYELHPERFVRGRPSPQPLPDAVWINPPEPGGNTDEMLPN